MEFDAYFVCATPRTGSSLLRGLLASTGVVGRPESYFRSEDEPIWAARWGIADPCRRSDYGDFLRHALLEGATENGVFAARVMWGTLDHIVERLRPLFANDDRGVVDVDLLHRAFGRIRFVYLRRDDVVAQTVSWLRAEQTDVWYETIDGRRAQPNANPRFDRGQIDYLLLTIDEHNRAWQEWFAGSGVCPHEVCYEDLNRDPVATARGIVDYLGLELPAGLAMEVNHRRLADRVNAEWIKEYRSHT